MDVPEDFVIIFQRETAFTDRNLLLFQKWRLLKEKNLLSEEINFFLQE